MTNWPFRRPMVRMAQVGILAAYVGQALCQGQREQEAARVDEGGGAGRTMSPQPREVEDSCLRTVEGVVEDSCFFRDDLLWCCQCMELRAQNFPFGCRRCLFGARAAQEVTHFWRGGVFGVTHFRGLALHCIALQCSTVCFALHCLSASTCINSDLPTWPIMR